jgi:cysteine desulfurase
MEPFFSVRFGNSSAVHAMGEDAKQAVEKAREQVASLINAKSDDIYFTNSATEANNIIIRGIANQHVRNTGPDIKARFLTTNVEHKSISASLEQIERTAVLKTVYLNIDEDGNIDLDYLDNWLKTHDDILLVSCMAANNEIGTIHDLVKIGEICKKYNVLFHTDAVQAIGKVDIDVDKMNIFALTMSGHKIYGPKGVGALYIRDESLVEPLTHGGYQNTFSSGTQNVPAIVGLGMACEILQLTENKAENERIKKLRDYLLTLLLQGISPKDILINGTMKNRLPNNLNITIKDIQAEILVKGMDDVIISGGAACQSGNIEPSHVIKALGTPYPDCAIRISLGRWTTKEEIKYAANRIIEVVNSMKEQ